MEDSFQAPAQINPGQIADIVIRRRWLVILLLCFSLTLGLFLTLTASKTYQASTLILVQQQSVPTSYVRSVVTASINQRINTISQQILSRSNLEQIISQFDLYGNREDLYLEEKIFFMRQRVKVKIERARHGAEAFSIQFVGSDPQKVMRITNTLASFFMNENLKVREAQAIGTSEFLYSELEKTRRKLEEHEQKISTFRSKYLGGLPDELESNLRTLDRLQQQLADKNLQLREAKNSLALVSSQLAGLSQPGGQGGATSAIGVDGFPPQTENEVKLVEAKREYRELLAKYTDKHPDILNVRKRIEKLEGAVKAERTSQTGDAFPGSANPAIIQLKLTEKQLTNDISKIEYAILAIEDKMKVYQKRVEETPKRELELQALKRDYKNIRDIYDSLLDRKLEAELSVNMEKKQKGEQFRIIDYARLPEKPISPNVEKYFMISVFLGLGGAVGIIFLLEFFDPFIRRDEQLEDDLGLNIIAVLPQMTTLEDLRKKRLNMVVFILCCVYASVLFSLFMLLSSKGLDRTINLIKIYLNF